MSSSPPATTPRSPVPPSAVPPSPPGRAGHPARVDARDVLVSSVNPGLVVGTSFASDFLLVRYMLTILGRPLCRSAVDGAMCYVYGALGLLGPESHGSYLSECRITS